MPPELRLWLATATAVSLLAGTGIAIAQEPWQEQAAPEPPALVLDGVVPVEVPRSTLRFGVQSNSVSIGSDAVVRYVVIATSATGPVNAMYEGIRCDAGEVKVYARHNPDRGWAIVKDAPWQPLYNNGAQRHSLVIARNGACIGRGTNRTPERVIRDLRAPADERFR